MNIKIIVGIVVVAALAGGVLLITSDRSGNQAGSACSEVCQKANQTCPSLINESACNNKCAKLSEESKKHLSESSSCEELTAKPDLMADLLIPEVNTPEAVSPTGADDCQLACLNYTNKCLTLVPNADQNLFNEGLKSCMVECAKWKEEKIGCMLSAPSCPAMTESCGL